MAGEEKRTAWDDAWLLAHVGHGRPLKAKASSAVNPASRGPSRWPCCQPAMTRRRLNGVDADLCPGVGKPDPQLNVKVGEEHQRTGSPVGWPVSSSYSTVPSCCARPNAISELRTPSCRRDVNGYG